MKTLSLNKTMSTAGYGLLAIILGLALQIANAARPNIVLIIADDLGYGELGCQGNPDVPTPNLDSLAKSGARFTSGYVTAPFCAPSRAGLITGRNQARFAYDINPVGMHNLNPRLGLPVKEVSLPQLLKRAGYVTGLIGKWHLGGTAKAHPQERGFDEFYGFLHEGHFFAPLESTNVTSFLRTNALPDGASRWTTGTVTWSTHTGGNEPPYDADNPLMSGTTPVEETDFLTDAWTRKAVDFIRAHHHRPFFLQIAHNAPHSPMQSLNSFLERFSHIDDLHRRVFAGMVAHMDQSVGHVLETLRQLGLEENTLIFFLSDNGGPTRELTSSNRPLRGGKGQLYEGGIRIPFMIRWPSQLPAGITCEFPVSSLDILPTALAAAEFSVPPAIQLDGINLLPFLTGEKQGSPHDALLWRYGPNSAIREGRWKLIRQSPSKTFQLYDLAADIGETENVSDSHPDVADRLKSRLDGWLQELPTAISVR